MRGAKSAKAKKVLRILMIASEAHPFSKTGGLADVATALPKALGRIGHHVTLVTPRYRGIDVGAPSAAVGLEVAGRFFEAGMIEVSLGPGARILFVDCPALYDRAGIYNERGVDYPDNAVRYGFLAAAALEWAGRQAEPFDIVHAHDWQAGLAPAYLRSAPGPRLPVPGTVFTIHNLAYQGTFDKTWVPRLGLRWEDFTIDGFEFFDRLSFLKAGINLATVVTTVSPTYAEEIQRPEFGSGFDGVMRARRDALVGILNGIDDREWNPAADPLLPAPFSATNLEGKAESKRAVLELFGFPLDAATLARPIIGMVSRMVDQKGLDLIAAAARDLLSIDATFIVVGTGEPRYQDMWARLARWRPDRVAAYIGFDERRAHLVEAGADMFLMPSRFEPCGLNQMYSLRYGTVPIVRAVGGLVDTVRPYNPRNGQGNGFLFADYQPAAMLAALADAVAAFPNKKRWTRLQKNGMKADFSWDRSAAEYVRLYGRVLKRPRKGRHQTG